MIFGKNYRKIEFDDIERLVNNKISENKTLDYKREIILEKGDEKKEFLYDVSSFTNSDGGVIIYGISEQKDINGNNTGIPEEICGLQTDNFDKLIQKIEDLIKTAIEPNIPNIVIKPLQKNSKKILLIGLNKTTGLPRMVTYNSTNKFYRRRNSGKYLVDVFELSQMFMENIEIFNEIDTYRINRLNIIQKGEFVTNIDPSNITLLHIIPISYFRYKQVNLTKSEILQNIYSKLKPIGVSHGNNRSNLEGYFIYNHDTKANKVIAYNQFFRNGIIEFFTHAFHQNFNGRSCFYLGWLELQVIDSIKNAIELYRELEISPPFVIYITITDVLDRYVEIRGNFLIDPMPFINNELLIPNIIINDFDESIESSLKVLFDVIWQSAGYRKSPYYNENNERIKT